MNEYGIWGLKALEKPPCLNSVVSQNRWNMTPIWSLEVAGTPLPPARRVYRAPMFNDLDLARDFDACRPKSRYFLELMVVIPSASLPRPSLSV